MMNYQHMTDDCFDTALAEILEGECAGGSVLSVPGIHEILSEHYNNDALDKWAAAQPYSLEIDKEDWKAVEFSGHRYHWSEALLQHCEQGTNPLPEPIAWLLKDAFEADTEGGHSFFPLLNLECGLSHNLHELMEAIV